MLPSSRCLTVTQVNSYVKSLLDEDHLLSNLWVKGEITNFKQAVSGHLYFSLKDSNSSLRCVMFSSNAKRLLFNLENGMKVMIQGYVSIYAKDGQFQLYVREVHTMGLGDLHMAFEQLKKKLAQEGLFDSSRKRPIPILPSKIGIVTSTAGAVLHDIITVSKRRNPSVNLIVAPTAVQGVEAPDEIVRAIKNLNRLEDLDLIIVARGGGSLEELWAFNTEEVARAIYESKIPIVSAIGHETDVTIADLVSDLRAPTPSAAAEMVIPCIQELQAKLQQQANKLLKNIQATIETNKLKLAYITKSKVMRNPLVNLDQHKQFLDYTSYRMHNQVNNLISKYESQLQKYAKQLDALSPLSILTRGYSICKSVDGKTISKVGQVEVGDQIKVLLQDGYLDCKVMARSDYS